MLMELVPRWSCEMEERQMARCLQSVGNDAAMAQALLKGVSLYLLISFSFSLMD